jgi:hypothetical protein
MDYSKLAFDFFPSSGIVINIALFLRAEVQLVLLRQCQSQGDVLPTLHVKDSVSVLRQSSHICNSTLWWTGWQWGTFRAKYFGLTYLFFYQSEIIFLSSGAFIYYLFATAVETDADSDPPASKTKSWWQWNTYISFLNTKLRNLEYWKLVICSFKTIGDNQSTVINKI